MLLPLHAQYALLVTVACRSNSPARAGALRVLQVAVVQGSRSGFRQRNARQSPKPLFQVRVLN